MAQTPVEFTTELLEKIPRVADIVSFRFERPDDYHYEPGQWGFITIPGPEGPTTHHFTHSSSPTESFLELTTRLRGTPFKNALDALDIGTQVTMNGPNGFFTLRDQVPRAVFLTGGIGVTPVRSILRASADHKRDRPMIVLYANRDEENMAFADELEQMREPLPSLRVVHILAEPSSSWKGDRGRIDEEIIRREVGDLEGWRFFVSGPPPMVEAMRTLLNNMSVTPDAVTLERFEGY